jgi:hypothetical protein
MWATVLSPERAAYSTLSKRQQTWSSGEFFQTLLKVLKACLTALLQNLMSVDSQASAGRRGRHSQFGNVT